MADMSIRERALLASVRGEDPSGIIFECEYSKCSQVVALGWAHSLALVYRMPGAGHAPFQCAEEQHFACCHDHAIMAMLECLFDHITPGPHSEQGSGYKEQILLDLQRKMKGGTAQ